jgi:hypothetical protein
MPQLNTMRIIWAALFASTFMYLGVILFVVQPPESPPDPVMLPALALVAMAVSVASFVVPAAGYRQAVAASKIEVTEETVPDPSRPESDVLPYREAPTITRKVAKKPKAALERAFMLYQTPFILSVALAEAVCLFGFMLGFLGVGLPFILPFWAMTWVLFSLRFPTLERVLGPLERAKGIVIPRP